MGSPVVQVRITDPELDAWMLEQQTKRGLTRSEFVRFILIKAKEGQDRLKSVESGSSAKAKPNGHKSVTRSAPTYGKPAQPKRAKNEQKSVKAPRAPTLTGRPRVHAFNCRCGICQPPKQT